MQDSNQNNNPETTPIPTNTTSGNPPVEQSVSINPAPMAPTESLTNIQAPTGSVIDPGPNPEVAITQTPTSPTLAPEAVIEQNQDKVDNSNLSVDSYNEKTDNEVANNGSVEWTASEFIENNKSNSWFIVLGAGTTVLAILLYLITREIIPIIAVVMASLSLGILSTKKPRVLQYTVSEEGIHVDQTLHKYNEFKWFATSQEDQIKTLILMPVKRLSVPLSIHYDPLNENDIIEIVAKNLPIKDYKISALDSITKKIRL